MVDSDGERSREEDGADAGTTCPACHLIRRECSVVPVPWPAGHEARVCQHHRRELARIFPDPEMQTILLLGVGLSAKRRRQQRGN